MNRTVRQRKPGRGRREEIADAALTLAFEAGPAAVSTSMIAQRLGITQPAIYKHYRSKREIWAAVGEEIACRIAANLARLDGLPHGPAEKIRIQVADHLRLIETIPALPEIVLLHERDAALLEMRNRVLEAMADFRARLVALVEEGIAQGEFSAGIDAEDAASLLMGLIQHLVLRMIISRRPAGLVAEAERLLPLLFHGLFPRRPPSGDQNRSQT